MKASQKEIAFIISVFMLLLFVSIGAKLYSIYNLQKMHEITTRITEHPLKVSNAALNFQLDVYKTRNELNNILFLFNKKNLNERIKSIRIVDQSASKNLTIVNNLILGEKGKLLAPKAQKLFEERKLVRDHVIALVLKDKLSTAKTVFEKNELSYIQLDAIAVELNSYARDRADLYQNESNELFDNYMKINIFIVAVLVCFFISLTYYIVHRISTFMAKNEQLNNQLNEKSIEMEKIIQESPNPIMLHDEDGKVVMVNKRWQELTGYSAQEIDTIQKWTQKAHGEKMDAVREEIDKVFTLKGKVNEGEYPIKTKNGDTLIWQFSSAPLGIINGKQTVISAAMDVTELKAKDEVMLIQSRYVAMDQMIGMIAHQWRQPLAIISMDANNIMADVELGSLDDKTLKETSHHILEQAAYLSNTINDFRNFFLLEKKKEELSMQEILEETQTLLASSLQNNEIALEIENESSSTIFINKGELIQVLINLINNAKDAMLQHTHDRKKITIKISENENEITMRICDNGGGIDVLNMEKIFDPYFTTKESLNGSGLGLYMSKMIITQHLNATITAENQEDGACFSIRLPKLSIEVKS